MIDHGIGVIIQARMGSTRLPGKVLMRIGPWSLIEHIMYRLVRLATPVTTVIATSEAGRDDILESFCTARNIHCFRGSELDVLDRYYQCSRRYGFAHIIRLTGDNPFPDMAELDRLIALHLTSGADYSHAFSALPVGVGCEVFTLEALERSWREGSAPHHREHVNEYMLENPRLFLTRHLTVPAPKSRPDVRLTVDTPADYRRACYIASYCRSGYVTTEEAIELAEAYEAQETEQ